MYARQIKKNQGQSINLLNKWRVGKKLDVVASKDHSQQHVAVA